MGSAASAGWFAFQQLHIVFLGVMTVAPRDFVVKISFFGGRDGFSVLHGLVIVQRRLQLAFEHRVAGIHPPDFDLNRTLGVIADALGIDRVFVPARYLAVELNLDAAFDLAVYVAAA